MLVCAWWNCREALGPKPRMLLRRTVVGINEKNIGWTRCARAAECLAVITFSGGGAFLDMNALWLSDARGEGEGKAGREILGVSASLFFGC